MLRASLGLALGILAAPALGPWAGDVAWAQDGATPPSLQPPAALDAAPAPPSSPAAATPPGAEDSGAPAPSSPLRVSLTTIAPPAVCAPSLQAIEIRNAGEVALGDVRVSAAPPLGPNLFAFTSNRIEISDDDGRTWTPLGPPTGLGSRASPYVWSSEQSPLLARLGPAGRPDDSVLIRWRAALGHGFTEAPADRRRLWLSATAVDAARRPVSAEDRGLLLPVRQPSLALSLVARNADRGGPFGLVAPAAPGDEIEWRLSVENRGDAPSPETRVRFIEGGAPPNAAIVGLSPSGGAAVAALPNGVFALGALGAGGRKTVVFRERLPQACVGRRVRVVGSWGCAAPPSGGLAPSESGVAEAVSLTRPRGDDAQVSIRVAGTDGRPRPGNRAEVVIEIANAGPPMFAPVAVTALPDGYVFDATAPVRLFGAGGVSRAEVATDVSRNGAPSIRLLDADGRPGLLDPGQRVEIRFAIRRDRPLVFEEDEAQVSLNYRDGCGAPASTPVSVAPTRPRSPEFALTLTPETSPIVGAPGETKRFRAEIVNRGRDEALGVRLRLRLGAGWLAEAPEGCVAEPISEVEGDAPRRPGFRAVCALDVDLRPRQSAQFDFPLTVSPAAVDGAPLSIAAEVEGQGLDATGAVAEGAIARASAEASAIGFQLEQALLTRDGRPRDPEAPLNLGERVGLAVTARWFGGAGVVESAALTQTLPSAFAVRNARSGSGDVGLESVLAPQGAGESDARSRVLWSLEDFDGGGLFEGRLDIEVIEPSSVAGGAAEPAASGPELLSASAGVNAVFTAGGRDYGVDALGDPGEGAVTSAPPLTVEIRRPEIRLSVALDDRSRTRLQSRDLDGSEVGRDAGLGYEVFGGETVVATVSLANRGAAPGFFDWVELRAPSFLRVADFATDALDNDGDGQIDEADEASAAVIERRVAEYGPPSAWPEAGPGDRVRWTTLGPSGVGASGAGVRINSGESVRWRLKFEVSRRLEPGRAGFIALDGQYGAAPFGQEGGETRSRLGAVEAVASPSVSGFLVLSRTSVGEDLSAALAHGEQVEHRLSLRLPPGAVRRAAVEVSLPDGLTDVTARARLGAGVQCDALREPEVVRRRSGEEVSRKLIWRFGRCQIALTDDEGARGALLDFTATARDADPAAPAEARAEHRQPRVSARFIHGASRERRSPLGQSALEISGPALNATVSSDALDAGARGALDAGDPVSARLTLENVGNAPLRGLRIEIPGRTEEADPASGVDCLQIRWRAPPTTGGSSDQSVGDGDGATCGPRFAAPAFELAPGEQVEIDLDLAVTRAARLQGRLHAPFRITAGAQTKGAPPVRVSAVALDTSVALPPAPQLELSGAATVRPPDVADRSGPAHPLGAIGDAFPLRARFEIPEGRAEDAELVLKLRLKGRSGSGDASALDIVSATLSRDRADLSAAADPGGINQAPAGARVEVRGLLEAEPQDAEGWRAFRLPLGALRVEEPTNAARTGAYLLEAAVMVRDAAGARQGLRIQALPELRHSQPLARRRPARAATAAPAADTESIEPGSLPAERAPAAAVDAEAGPLSIVAGERRVLALLAEPFVEIAATVQSDLGALARGDALELTARACNRGGAPAFGVRLEGALPPELRLSGPASARLAPAKAGPLQPYGPVRVDVDGALEVSPTDPLARLDPGACVALSSSATLWSAPAQSEVAATFRVAGYQGRPSRTQPGRRYARSREATALIPVARLSLTAPAVADLGAEDLAIVPISVRAPRGETPLRLSVRIAGAAGLVWRLHRDANGDRTLDDADPLWRDGETLPPDRRIRLLAVAERVEPLPVGWRGTAAVSVFAIGPNGESLRGAHNLVIARDSERAGELRTARRMALDRDCDGQLEDEAGGGAFASSLEAAPGECVVMRLSFRNVGVASVEEVAVEDTLFPGAALVPGSARFVETPNGLIAKPVARDQARLSFGFVGALAPGLRGLVEYRLRLGDP